MPSRNEATSRSEFVTTFVRSVADKLASQGWDTTAPVYATRNSKGDSGRIDLVATRGRVCVAVCVEASWPSHASVWKLTHFAPATSRVIAVLKGHGRLTLPAGVDCLVANVPPREYGRRER